MLTAAALTAPKFAAHIPGRIIEDATEDGTKFESVRLVNGTVKVVEDGESTYWYKGRRIERLETSRDVWGHTSTDTWMAGRYTFASLTEAKAHLDSK